VAVRDSKGIIAHLPEVPLPLDKEDAAGVLIAALKGHKVLVGIGAVGIAGTVAAAVLVRKKRRSDAQRRYENFSASLNAYLQAMQDGSLDESLVVRLISDMTALQRRSDDGKSTIPLSIEHVDALVRVVVGHTQALADANGLDLDVLEPDPDSHGDSIVALRCHLEAQRKIYNEAA
jgi:type II secretory pathway pseudopilin PulG